MKLEDYIANVPDFPIPGIQFKDVTPLVADGEAFKHTIKIFADYAKKHGADVIVGPDARGFIFGTPVAYELGLGFIPVRKPGKLPREVISEEYDLEYGHATLTITKDSVKPGQRVVIVDDLLATGGTIQATTKLVERLGGIVAGICFVIELPDLNGRAKLEGYDVYSLLQYNEYSE